MLDSEEAVFIVEEGLLCGSSEVLLPDEVGEELVKGWELVGIMLWVVIEEDWVEVWKV